MSRSLLLIIISAISIGGCSKVLKSLDHVRTDTKNQYEKAETMPDLEIPPGLSTEAIRDRMVIPEGGESAKFSTYQDRRAEVDVSSEAEDTSEVVIGASQLLENEHALSINHSIVDAWPVLQNFVQSQGYQLELNDVDLGIVETAWKEDSRIARNKFKIFAEEDNDSRKFTLYISIENQELLASGEGVAWQRVARSIEKEKAFVGLLETQLVTVSGGSSGDLAGQVVEAIGVIMSDEPARLTNTDIDEGENVDLKQEAPTHSPSISDDRSVDMPAAVRTSPVASELVSVGSGKFYMALSSDYESAWKVVGNILDTTGFKVKQADKMAGLYLIEAPKSDSKKSKKSLLKKAQFWKRTKRREFQLSLTGVGRKTEVVILDSRGRWLTGGEADNLLNRLHEAVNSGRI